MKKFLFFIFILTSLIYPVDVIVEILHIGDSISKMTVRTYISSWLTTNYPSIEYVASDTNNQGITDRWYGYMWQDFYQYNPDILLLNTGMWDSYNDTSEFQDKFPIFLQDFHGYFPRCRIVWASTTLKNSLPGNDTIISNNAFAITALDAEYGAGEWYYIDMAQVQIDSSVTWDIDSIHPDSAGYVTYAQEWINTLDTIIPTYTYGSYAFVDSVAFGVCNTCPSDFKTGLSPTITISNDTAHFSIAQTNNLMGVGAAVYYDDGDKKIGYLKPSGKITTSTWLISNAVGEDLAGCTDATIDSINHPYNTLALAAAGFIDADHINNTNRRSDGANICVHITCYMDQTSYVRDQFTTAVFNVSEGDGGHQLYVYSPSDTFTQCNFSHANKSMKFDTTKYYARSTSLGGIISKTTTRGWTVFKDLQLYHAAKAGTGTYNMIIWRHDVDFDYVAFSKCFIMSDVPNTTGTHRTLVLSNNGTGVAKIDNCVFLCVDNAGINSGEAIYLNQGTDGVVSNCTFVGAWTKLITKVTSGKMDVYNTIVYGMQGTFNGSDIRNDYNVYDNDESEAHGILTTQSYGQLFTDTTQDTMMLWDFSPLQNSDIDTSNILYSSNFHYDISDYLYDSAYANPGAYQIRNPTIDSIRCTVLRDSTYLFAYRNNDTCIVYGYGFDDSLWNTHFYNNSTGSVSASIVSWHNNSTHKDSAIIIPYGAVPGYYKPFFISKDSSKSNNSHLWCKKPGRL